VSLNPRRLKYSSTFRDRRT